MKRRLFIVPAAVSLVLCVATIVLWHRSYSYAEKISYDSRPQRGNRYRAHVGSEFGRFVGYYHVYKTKLPTPTDLQPAPHVGFRFTSHAFSPSPFKPKPQFAQSYEKELLGFGWRGEVTVVVVPQINRTIKDYAIAVPYWALALLFSIAPAAQVVRRLKKRRRDLTRRCASCGYDLRATPDRCPECGTAAAGAGTTA